MHLNIDVDSEIKEEEEEEEGLARVQCLGTIRLEELQQWGN